MYYFAPPVFLADKTEAAAVYIPALYALFYVISPGIVR
jgi:hypothetical protein